MLGLLYSGGVPQEDTDTKDNDSISQCPDTLSQWHRVRQASGYLSQKILQSFQLCLSNSRR